MSVAIGIDLGTTNTVVAAVVDGVAVTLEDERGVRLLPSVVSFHPSGTVLVGEPARERRLIDPENTIFSVKPLIGRAFTSEEVTNARGRFPFTLVEGAKNATMVMARDVPYALPEISAFVLRRAKALAEGALRQTVDRAVITVPANFNDLQRASTKIAGKLAGLEVMRILNEPTAAALAYGQSIAKAEKIAVYDLGGGTFDITLLDLTGNVFEVLATAGDTALGGDDIDRVIAERIATEVVKRFNFDPRSDPVAFGRLRFIAEEMKQELSTRELATRDISGIGYTDAGQPISMPMTVSRDDLDKLAHPFIQRTVDVSRQSIEIVGLNPKDFDRVILVGGSTRMPIVPRYVEALFGQPSHLKVNPDEVVALGAAIQAHALNRSKGVAKRKSAHDQLAQSKPQQGQNQAPGTPQYFEFSKAAAVITFSPPPAEMFDSPSSSAKPSLQQPPLPDERTLQMPASPQAMQAAQQRAQSAAPPRNPPPPPLDAYGSQAARRPIEGQPARSVAPPTNDIPGPKPPRNSMQPPFETPRATPHALRPPAPPTGDLGLDDPFGEPPGIPDLVIVPRSQIPAAAPPGPVSPAPMPAAARVSAPPHDPNAQLEGRMVAFSDPPNRLGAMVAAGDFFPEEDIQLQRGPSLTDGLFAKGSAIAAADNAPLLIDVTPLTLRVETVGGYSDILVDANTPVPCERTRAFLTASDNQTTVFIRVAQGESQRYAENTHLGELELSGLPPAPRGNVKILVTFELDADGILNVRAKDKDSGRETAARMRLLGANTDAGDVAAMEARQARHAVA